MKKIIKFFSVLMSSVLPTTLASCSNDNGFYYANFQSYMSDTLLSRLESGSEKGIDGSTIIENFNYRTFSTNEDLERNFYTNYDVAVPSTYLTAKLANEGELMVIDWSKFNLYKLDKYGNKTEDKVENAADALTLFTPQVRATLLSYDLKEAKRILDSKYPDEAKIFKQEGGLLNFCVPYFLQNLGLTYKSNDGTNWDFGNGNDNLSWPEIMKTLRNKIDDGSINKIAATDDSRILYSVARLIQTSQNDSTPYVNPSSIIGSDSMSTTLNETISIDDFKQTYKYLTEGIKKNTYYLNSDSNILLNLFAYPGSTGADAIFSYNGDTLYGSQGGDSYSYDAENPTSFKNWIVNYFAGDNFKIKTTNPENSFLLLDTMVINRKRVLEKNHVQLAYDVLYKIGLEGADHSLYTDDKKTEYNNETSNDNDPIFTSVDDEFKYGPMLNFSYVQYVSPLKTINAYVLNTCSTIEQNYKKTESYYGVPEFAKSWFDNETTINETTIQSLGSLYDSLSTSKQGIGFYTELYKKDDIVKTDTNNGFLNQNQYNNFINTLIDIYSITKEVNPNNIARNLSDLNKSNMSWAYTNMKELYF